MVPVCVQRRYYSAVQLPNVYISDHQIQKRKRKTRILPPGKECEENPAIGREINRAVIETEYMRNTADKPGKAPEAREKD